MSDQQTLLTCCPEPSDTSDFHFKLVQRIGVYLNEDVHHTFCNLLTVSNAYGLTFIGASNGFYVAKTNSIYEGAFKKKFIQLNSQVTHLAVNCNDSYLAAGSLLPDKTCVVFSYAIDSLVRQNSVTPLQKIVISSAPSVSIVELVCNPAVPNLLSSCLTDGSIVLFEINSSSPVSTLPAAAAARCLCWSPKGKQFVVGSEDGKLTQYRPDMKAAKALPAPPLQNGNMSVVSVYWISNFQFAAYYRNRSDASAPPVLFIINAGKNQPVTYINYEDVTYGSNTSTCSHFYFYLLATWNVIVLASANSAEVAVLSLDQAETWKHWIVSDSSRAEMPLSSKRDETFPLGMAVDLSSQSALSWGESSLSPMPRLLLLSSEGTLCAYHIVGLMAAAKPTCAPPAFTLPDSLFDAPLVPTSVPSPTPLISTAESKASSVDSSSKIPFFTAPTEIDAQKLSSNVSPFKSDLSQIPVKSNHSDKVIEPKDEPESNDDPEPDASVMENAIIDEILTIDDDLLALALSLKLDESLTLGGAEDFSDSVRWVSDLVDYSRSIEEATHGHAEEVDELKLDTLELRARIEDVSLLVRRNSSQLCSQLHRSDQMDPYTSRILKEILSLRTYINSQISLLTDHLELQWENHQRSCRKDAKSFLKNPFMEDVLKTLTIQKKLIAHHKGELDQMQKNLELSSIKSLVAVKAQNSLSKNVSTAHSRSLDFSKLVDSFLGLNMQDKGEALETDDLMFLVKEKKIKEAKSSELSAAQLTAILDRFGDAQVPTVSQVVRFSERVAYRKKVAARMKTTAERTKECNAVGIRDNIPLPVMVVKNENAPALKQKSTKMDINAMRKSFSGENTIPVPFPNQKLNNSFLDGVKENKPNAIASESSTGFDTTSAFSPVSISFVSSSETSSVKKSLTDVSAVLPSSTPKFSFSATETQSFSAGAGFQGPFAPKPSSTTVVTQPNLPSGVTLTPLFCSSPSPNLTVKPFAVTETNVLDKQAISSFQTTATAKIVTQPAVSKTDVIPSEVSIFPIKSPVTAQGNGAGLPMSTVAPQSKLSVPLFGPSNSGKESKDNKVDVAQDRKDVEKQDSCLAAKEVVPASIDGSPPISANTTASIFRSLETKPSIDAARPTGIKDSLYTSTATTSVVHVPSISTQTSTSPLIISTTANAPSPPLFGFFSSPTTTNSKMPVTVASSAIFGTVASPAPQSTSSIFGTKPQNIFQATPTSTGLSLSPGRTTSNVFGGSTVSAPTSLLGSPAQTSSAVSLASNIFGGAPGEVSTTGISTFTALSVNSPSKITSNEVSLTTDLFGQVLGGSSSPVSAKSNIFGNVTPSKPTFGSGGSIFSNVTHANSPASIFAQNSNNVFGASSTKPFGSVTNAFNPPSMSSQPIFGGSPFGGNGISQSFGQSPSTTFATPAVSSQSIFGSIPSTFGSNQAVSSTTPLFGSGAFSSNAFAASGFNNASSPNAQPGFGSAPIFSKPSTGSAQVFGGSPSSSPAFGGSAIFGSPSVFGSPSPQKVFSSPTNTNNTFGQSPGFEAASQSTVGFANLAQQQSGFGSGFGTPQTSQQPSSFGPDANIKREDKEWFFYFINKYRTYDLHFSIQ